VIRRRAISASPMPVGCIRLVGRGQKTKKKNKNQKKIFCVTNLGENSCLKKKIFRRLMITLSLF